MIQPFLDTAEVRVKADEELTTTPDTLVHDLHGLRQGLPSGIWYESATIGCRQHPVMQLLQQDPFTSRAFRKPRGYAGDAVMLDYIYAAEDGFALPDLDKSSELGRRINQYTSNGAAPRAVRARRRIIVDRLSEG